jgi:hypothetical protein
VQGRYLSDITLEEVLQYVHLPSSEASKRLGLGTLSHKCHSDVIRVGYRLDPLKIHFDDVACARVGLTSFKRVCRSVGIMSWPYKAGKQPSREELITSALESGSKRT